jgi:hypothetical protein
MEAIDWSKFTFRCSSYGALMTDPREGNGITDIQAGRLAELQAKEKRTEKQDEELAKLIIKKNAKPELSDTCKTELIKIYVSVKYGRVQNIENKYVKKGLAVEEDSITLLSRIKHKFYEKNDERLFNEFTNGEPDLFEGRSIRDADLILDTKSSWDIFTFFASMSKPVLKDYFWQMQGYMDLSGAREARLIYCLINTPDVLINEEKRKLLWKMGVTTELNPDYLKACELMDKAMTYDDIPLEEKFFEQIVPRDDKAIQAMHDRAVECRKWLAEYDQARQTKLLQAA